MRKTNLYPPRQAMHGRPIPLRWWVGLVCMLWACAGMAQVHITRGTSLPPNPSHADWFYDTLRHEAAIYATDQWQSIYFPCYKMDAFGPWVVMETSNHGIMCTDYRVKAWETLSLHYQSDSVIALKSAIHLRFLHINGDTLVAFKDSRGVQRLGAPIQFRGQDAFCLPAYFPASGFYVEYNELRNFGILDSKGNWVIAPMFDQPFQFTRGIAEVQYYGQDRKINEQGEFVE